MISSGKRAGRLVLLYVSVLVVLVLAIAASSSDQAVIGPNTTTLFLQSKDTTSTIIPTTSLPTSTTAGSTTSQPPSTTATTIPSGPIAGEQILFGRSVNGEPLVYIRRGDSKGARILVIGSIHGDEDDGIPIVDHLRRIEIPEGVELWLIHLSILTAILHRLDRTQMVLT